MKPVPAPDLSLLSPLAPELASTIARVSSDIALVIDRDGVIVSVAQGAAPLAPSCAAWVGRPWAETASADSRRKLELLLAEVGESGIGRRREINHPDGDGGAIPVAWSAIRLGEGGAVVAVGRDLRAVAAIQQRFLDAQQEQMPDRLRTTVRHRHPTPPPAPRSRPPGRPARSRPRGRPRSRPIPSRRCGPGDRLLPWGPCRPRRAVNRPAR